VLPCGSRACHYGSGPTRHGKRHLVIASTAIVHPTALVHPEAQLGHHVSVGPYSIVEHDVVIGDHTTIDSHVLIKAGTEMASHNRVYKGVTLGETPQHLSAPDITGTVTIGSRNTFRENVTIHRGLEAGKKTTIGDGNLLMVGAHVAHDCVLGDHVIVTNNALLGGHVTVEDRAYISGAVGIHQFCRVGTMAMVGAHARCVQDVPPYVTVDGRSSQIVGLNLVGLRRSGVARAEIKQIKEAYRLIYRSGLPLSEVLEQLKAEFDAGPAAYFYPFLAASKRGFMSERRSPPGGILKLHDDPAKDVDIRKVA
jgi:UDP-N-acetylglucosamine acyltransferase